MSRWGCAGPARAIRLPETPETHRDFLIGIQTYLWLRLSQWTYKNIYIILDIKEIFLECSLEILAMLLIYFIEWLVSMSDHVPMSLLLHPIHYIKGEWIVTAVDRYDCRWSVCLSIEQLTLLWWLNRVPPTPLLPPPPPSLPNFLRLSTITFYLQSKQSNLKTAVNL